MLSSIRFPLTLALSPEERVTLWDARGMSTGRSAVSGAANDLPLLWGEGGMRGNRNIQAK